MIDKMKCGLEKLSSLSKSGELLVSDRFFNQIPDKFVQKCCPCSEESDLWEKLDISNDKFDFSVIYKLQSKWCPIHGAEFCRKILELDDK